MDQISGDVSTRSQERISGDTGGLQVCVSSTRVFRLQDIGKPVKRPLDVHPASSS